ncbi:oocyte zinc finger protein XlCOF8.4 [Drosophila novamexicana]|uniref:oocyte zinc finger protein XlCOF8.4 n=1 Tax=Drosophila novamexicana TaxID=47314 RepID=UPI0011E5E137|nr:oocyte zinc finger protein XlCOF8.4 [Drosophila novamexicana]
MTLKCRTCATVIYNMNAKNLFERENSEILMNIEMVAGTALVSSPELPSHICACCLLDLKQAVYHIQVFRERCIKTQEQLLSTHIQVEPCSEGDSDLVYEFNSYDNIKLENNINVEEVSVKSNRSKDDFDDEEAEFHENEEDSSNDMEASFVEGFTEDTHCLMTGAFSSDSQGTNEEFRESADQDLSQYDSYNDISTSPSFKSSKTRSFANVLIKPTETSESADKKPCKEKSNESSVETKTHKVKKTYLSWKNLTEEQIIERRRQQRRRDCICDQCGRHFTDQSNFKLHMLRHTGVKNFKCKECSRLFYTEHLLQLHERTVHRGERPYACKYCDKTFNSSTTRVIHERSHTNVRPYSCEYCDKSFISTSALKRHDLTHNGVRSFYCKICDKTFQRNTHLKAHLRSKLHALRETNISLLREFE